MRSNARYPWIWLCVAVGVGCAAAAAGALALSAWRKTELESQARRPTFLELVRYVTREHADELSNGAREAASRAEASETVGYARGGRFVGYEPGPAATEEPTAGAEELRCFALSTRGGESYESSGDFARAVDAYSFFLSRIVSPVLRAKLRLAVARAAERAGNAVLARAIHLELFESSAGAATESGLPIDLVSALRLIESRGLVPEVLLGKLRERIDAGMHRIPTPFLVRLAHGLGETSGRLAEVIEARHRLEQAIEACPEILTNREAAVVGSTIVLARDEPSGARVLRAAPWDWYRPPEKIQVWTYVVSWRPTQPADSELGVSAEPVHLRPGGPLLGYATTTGGGGFEAYRRWAYEDGRTERVGVVLQALAILSCCAMLLALLRRERQLARLRERLLANVSHELKTPVTSVRMFAELLGQAGLDPGEATLLRGHLRRESARLSQLVENLLDLSRPERVEARLGREPVDVRALLCEIVDGFTYRARDAGVTVETRGLGDGALVLETNGPAVARIVLNLLDNALKYRRDNGSRILVSLESAQGGVSVSVEDNGPGIPAPEHRRVFEELFRGRFEDYRVQGMGLGLSIARRLARKLGGDVTVASRVGAGSTFTLTLPAAPSSAASAKGVAA